MTFKQALRSLPRCIRGLDLEGQHHTVADLRFLVRHEIDLHEEGDDTDIRNARDWRACKRFLARTAAQS